MEQAEQAEEGASETPKESGTQRGRELWMGPGELVSFRLAMIIWTRESFFQMPSLKGADRLFQAPGLRGSTTNGSPAWSFDTLQLCARFAIPPVFSLFTAP